MRNNIDIIDKIGMVVSAGLIFLGVIVLGIVEILAGRPYGASTVEETNEAGEVINTLEPAVDPNIRVGLVLLGLLVMFIWGMYKMFSPQTVGGEEREDVEATA